MRERNWRRGRRKRFKRKRKTETLLEKIALIPGIAKNTEEEHG